MTPAEIKGRCGGKEYYVDPSGMRTQPGAADMQSSDMQPADM